MSLAINALIKGYQHSKQHQFQSKQFQDLVEFGQQPKVLVIACCDSRVDPAIVTNCNPGDLFVVRNVANLVPPFESDPSHHGVSAALEYGVKHLKVSDIIVFGHSQCGGIRALVEAGHQETPPQSDFIHTWMNIAAPAQQKVLSEHSQAPIDQQAHQCEKASLLCSLTNLKTFPWIEQAISAGQLALHAWYFDMAAAQVEAYQAQKQCFVPLEQTTE